MLAETYIYTKIDIIRLRMIRDSLGVMTESTHFTRGERDLIIATIMQLTELPGIREASHAKERGVACVLNNWNEFQ